MAPMTHLLFGWAIAQQAAEQRDRFWICMAGIAPDIDGAGLLVDLCTRNSANPTDYWGTYHHILGHNLIWGLVFCALASIWTKSKLRAAAWILVSFHLHLFCDLIGGRGPASPDYPEGYQWPMPYLFPFSDNYELIWGGQWALNAWPNFLCTGVLLLLMLYWAIRKQRSPLELVSQRADQAFVQTLRQRFSQQDT